MEQKERNRFTVMFEKAGVVSERDRPNVHKEIFGADVVNEEKRELSASMRYPSTTESDPLGLAEMYREQRRTGHVAYALYAALQAAGFRDEVIAEIGQSLHDIVS